MNTGIIYLFCVLRRRDNRGLLRPRHGGICRAWEVLTVNAWAHVAAPEVWIGHVNALGLDEGTLIISLLTFAVDDCIMGYVGYQ